MKRAPCGFRVWDQLAPSFPSSTATSSRFCTTTAVNASVANIPLSSLIAQPNGLTPCVLKEASLFVMLAHSQSQVYGIGLRGGPHPILLSNDLRLNDPINGHRAIRAGLGRGVDHAAGIPLQDGTRNVDGAALSL